MPLSAAALEPLLRLALVPGIGARRLASLIRHFGSAERVFGAPERELRLFPGMGAELAARVRRAAGPSGGEAARRGLRRLERAGAVALTPDDLAFPDAFRVVPEPPYLLFAAGRLDLLGRPSVALVGTRSPTRYGCSVAEELGRGLAATGYVIVSGMARGIDAAAHAAALDAGGGTVGVLGHGIDQVYPAENRSLFRRVRTDGLLLSDLVPGERPRAGNFPRRNRLIAALSQAVVVVEMGLKSGAQHTVTYALEQGKEVLAVPGPIGAPQSAGTNQLLKEGARVVTAVADVVEELQGVGAGSVPAPARAEAEPALALASPTEHRLLSALSSEPKHVDELVSETELMPGALLSVLLELELRGLAESLPGKRYRRA